MVSPEELSTWSEFPTSHSFLVKESPEKPMNPPEDQKRTCRREPIHSYQDSSPCAREMAPCLGPARRPKAPPTAVGITLKWPRWSVAEDHGVRVDAAGAGDARDLGAHGGGGDVHVVPVEDSAAAPQWPGSRRPHPAS